MEEKGVSVILEAAGVLTKQSVSQPNMEIDFYGLFESEEYKAFFESELAGLNSWVRYKGYLDIRSDPGTAYNILAGYDCLLFPTQYPGEGFPGVLLDAFIAGLPIICSDWNMNAEIVSHGKHGIVLKENTPHELMHAMLSMKNDKAKWEAMSLACRASAQQFDAKRVLDKALNELLLIHPLKPQALAV
jgi:glycosyltransferase involved in cell wall biosynthesis